MVIDSDFDSDTEDTTLPGADVAGGAYHETVISVDGFTRRPNGQIKFNKDTKKRRRENDGVEDVEMGDVEPGSGKSKKNKRKSEVKLGHEFKAKVTPFYNVGWFLWSLIAQCSITESRG
jgi:ribosomal RNA-processing protein 12